MKIHIYLRLMTVAVFFYLVSRMPLGNATEQCKSQGSVFKKALKRHMFDMFKVSRPDTCIKRCQSEPNCQSLNYVIEGSICELNDRSKETRPDDYVTDTKRIYMSFPFNRVPLGSTPEVPAVSCMEIKVIREESVSGDYWLDRDRTGKAIQTYCPIGEGSLFHWTLSGTDTNLLNLRGAARFVEENGENVLYLDGTQGTYAETSAVPFQQTDFTIAVWIKLVSPLSGKQEIYADWSYPWQFLFSIQADGRLSFTGRRNVDGEVDFISVWTVSSVDTDVWRHVAVTWGRADRKVRLFINGDVKEEEVISEDSVLDLKMSGHSVYDIGLKRDSGTITRAYFSDLMVFTHELLENELKNYFTLSSNLFI